MVQRPVVAIHRRERSGLQLPPVAVADVAAELPGSSRVLPPVLRIVAQVEGGAASAATHGFDQWDSVVEIAGTHVDLLAASAPVVSCRTNPHLPRVDGARRRGCDCEIGIR